MNALRTQSIGRMERMCPSAVVFFLRDVTPARIPARWRADVLGMDAWVVTDWAIGIACCPSRHRSALLIGASL